MWKQTYRSMQKSSQWNWSVYNYVVTTYLFCIETILICIFKRLPYKFHSRNSWADNQDSQGTVNWLQLVALYMWTMICSIWQRDLVYWLLLGLCWLLEVMLSPGGCWEWSPGTEERELDHLADLIGKQANHAKGALLPVSEWVHPALFTFYFWKEPVLVAMYLWPIVFVCFVFLVKHATCRCATSSWKKPSLGVRSDLSAVLCKFLFCWVFHSCAHVLMVKLMCCWLYFSCCSFRLCSKSNYCSHQCL